MQRSRFGEMAVARGFLTPGELEAAWRAQDEDERAGRPARPVGVIALQAGWLSFRELVTLLGAQGRAPARGKGLRGRRQLPGRPAGQRAAPPPALAKR